MQATIKPRGFSDPPHMEFERAVYGSSLTAPAALGSKMKYAEPYASISATELLSEDISHSGWIRKEGLSIRTCKFQNEISVSYCSNLSYVHLSVKSKFWLKNIRNNVQMIFRYSQMIYSDFPSEFQTFSNEIQKFTCEFQISVLSI